MATEQLCRFMRRLRALADGPAAGRPTDGQLLERFCARRDEAAFADLVRRHGGMVLAVCRRALANAADAEDAFQATFLVLSRKAPSIRKVGSVGSWLYGVARRVAVKARTQDARRRRREGRAAAAVPLGRGLETAPQPPAAEAARQELRELLDEELGRLPEKYRAPVVLCCLEGKTHEQAARELGGPKSSLTSRLARARGMLRRRLVRRGVALSAALAAAVLAEEAVPAAPALLTAAAVRCAAAGQAAAGLIPGRVAALAAQALRPSVGSGAKIVAAVLLAAGAACLGAGVLRCRPAAGHAAPPAAAAVNPPAPADDDPARVDRNGDPLPDGASARMGTLRFRHQHTVRSVAYSPDGATVLSSSWDGTARVWDAATGRELHRFFFDDEVTPFLSPDGKIAAGVTGGFKAGKEGKSLRLWDAKSGKELLRDDGPYQGPLRFSPDGTVLAVGAARGVRLWDVAAKKELSRFTAPKEGLGTFVFLPDGKTLAAACGDRTVRFWDVATAKELRKLPSPQLDLSCLAVSPDGRTLATGGGDLDRTVCLWDAQTGKVLHRTDKYDGWVRSLAFSPDGKSLASGDQRGKIRIYDVASGKEICQCGLHADDWVMSLAFSPEGKTLAAGGTNEKAVRFFDATTGEERRPYAGHQDEVVGVAFLPDGTVVSGGRDDLVCVWAPAEGRVIRRWEPPGGVQCFTLAPDGKALAIGGKDGAVRTFDPATGKARRHFGEPGGWVSSVAFSPDGGSLGAAAEKASAATVCVWDAVTGKERFRVRPPELFVNALPFAFSPDGATLLTGTGNLKDHPFCLWDAADGKLLRQFPGDPDGEKLFVAHSPDGRLFASAGWSETTHVTEVATGKPVRQFKVCSSALAFSPDGRTLATGGVDGIIHLWDLSTGKERRRFHGHEPGGDCHSRFASGVSALAFSADGKRLVSGGGDTTVLLWDLSDLAAAEARPAAPTREQLDAFGDDLSSGDAAKAQEAVWALAAAPEQAVPFLADRLKPAQTVDAKRVAGLIAALDSDEFEEREAATRALEKLGEAALPRLRAALGGRPSPEARRRMEALVERLDRPDDPERLGGLRAVEVLELAGTPSARELLHKLAAGAPDARLTLEAKASLGRLAGRVGDRR